LLLLWWRGPDWARVGDAFEAVYWRWVGVALALNLLSVLVRAVSWNVVIRQALPRPQQPPFTQVFSAFAIGLLANAVLPGRIGELARVGVLARRTPRGQGITGRLLGTVFAHRLFDLIPALLLTAFVLATTRIPHWAVTSLELVAVVGIALFLAAILVAGRELRPLPEGAMAARRLLAMAQRGLQVLREPRAAALAALLQTTGWLIQLFAVWSMMKAFGIDAPISAAGVVLLLMNVATIFPLWPGNIGLLQAVVALPLVSYGVAYSTGLAFGLGLQVLEMSVGVGVGTIFLMREGLSLETLRRMPAEEESEESVVTDLEQERRARAGVSG
ncbi:MAG TPA: lysylphosphatidylglycerol synthase transmembrane domain-containing protein, partial [Gaiellaceae bacterium]|nr:lysylphosphatidylglycerol synthase transmembrane domain-containing protein [Gaiellaceae bacterium]